MVENLILNKLIPGSINFGMNILYSNEDMPWNKDLIKKQNMINEKIVEHESVNKVFLKNSQILENEQKRQNSMLSIIKEIDNKIESMKEEADSEEYKDLVNFRNMLQFE